MTPVLPNSGEAAAKGREADLWYCPLCGYIDPKTRDTRCPRPHSNGRHPMFRQAVYGYYIRIGLAERDVAPRPRPHIRGGAR